MRDSKYFLLVIILLLFSIIGFVVNATTIDSCQNLSSSGSYTLNTSVSSNATCFTIGIDNVTLDCAGFNVTYGNAGVSGYGINNTDGYDNITVKNCKIIEGNSTGDNKAGIIYSSSYNGVIINNTITSIGDQGIGIYLTAFSYNNTVNANIAYVNGLYGAGILFEDSSNNNSVNVNAIHTNGSDSYGIYLYNSSDNNFSTNTISITSNSGYGFLLDETSSSNKLNLNTINANGTSAYGIYLSSSSSNNLNLNTINTNDTIDSIFLVNSNGNVINRNNLTILNLREDTHNNSGCGNIWNDIIDHGINNTVTNTTCNTAPEITLPAIYPSSNVHVGDAILFNTAYIDADNNTGNVTFELFYNGTNTLNLTNTSVANGTTVVSSKVLSGLNVGDNVSVRVYATDGTNSTLSEFSNNITLIAVPVSTATTTRHHSATKQTPRTDAKIIFIGSGILNVPDSVKDNANDFKFNLNCKEGLCSVIGKEDAVDSLAEDNRIEITNNGDIL